MARSKRKLGRPPNAEGRNTRERILEAALELFAARGFAATSVRQLASAVGTTEGALYVHFAGKREVFEELFREAGPAVVAAAVVQPHTVAADGDPAAFVKSLVDGVLERWGEPRARKFTGVILRECTTGADGAPSLNAGISEALNQVGRIFRRWIRSGWMRGDFPPEHLAWELLAPLVSLRFAHLHPNASAADIKLAKAAGQRHVEYFLSCAMNPSTKEKQHGN